LIFFRVPSRAFASTRSGATVVLPLVFRASSALLLRNAESPGTAPNTRESGERERETDATTVETRTRGVDDARRWASARDARVAGGGGARARWRGSIVLWEV
jgi:hypothetical protein